MISRSTRSNLLAVLFVLVASRARLQASEQRIVAIFGGQSVSVPLPDGWTFQEKTDPATGIQTVAVGDPKGEVDLSVSFLPDPEGNLATRKGLEDLARHVFATYVDGSVEKTITLTPFDAPGGLGVLTSFTDAKLDPKHIPPGERLISTTGLRSWKGGYLMFTLLTDSRDSPAYKTALALARDGIRVKLPVSF